MPSSFSRPCRLSRSPRAVALGLAATLTALSACSSGDAAPGSASAPSIDAALAPALAAITADGLMAHTKALSDDSLEGRAPATPGEDKTVAYLQSQFAAMGLKGGMPDGSFVQNATFSGIIGKPEASFRIGSRVIPLSFPADYIARTRHEVPVIDVDAEMVFVGYGVDAPEYGWNDYKNVDVKGKVLVMLVSDPAVTDANDSTKLDSTMFKGKAMTYYGRWTYKYEIATAKGAAGELIIHETGPAGYPFDVLSGNAALEQFDIATADGNTGRTKVEGWITQPKAEALLKAVGKDFAALKAAARRKDFAPISLGASAKIHISNSTRRVASRNVVATLEGSDATRKNEYVI